MIEYYQWLLKWDQWHSILGVWDFNSAQEVYRKSYKKLCLQHHPDKGGSADIFKIIVAAWAKIK